MPDGVFNELTGEEVRTKMDEGEILPEETVLDILRQLKLVLFTEDTLVNLTSPVIVVGNVHGQYEDVQKLFQIARQEAGVDINRLEGNKYLFMGDYVDHGSYSLNTFLLLATYKVENPNQVFLLRGDHETRQSTQRYGFMNECTTKYGHSGIWAETMRVFDFLPIAALIDGSIFSVHAGISPELPFVNRLVMEKRVQELPESGVLADLMWSDPDHTNQVDWRPNSRGAGYIYGKKVLRAFCRVNKLQYVTRSHQVVMEGFKWYFGNEEVDYKNGEVQGKLISVWSAPNFRDKSGNKASLLHIQGATATTHVFTEAVGPARIQRVLSA
jgi:diadenosine tetraphosphatase ApaH/serine/threonine PP2A family protein phosphatase